MINYRFTQPLMCSVMLALGTSVWAAEDAEKDMVSPDKQSDEQISVWVDGASLDLFVSQLATITGREAAIEGDVQGQVSGRFNGSMADTLWTIREQFPVIFDMDDTSLGVVPESARSEVTVALGGVELDDVLYKTLLAEMPAGNEIELGDSEVVIAGHPEFVARTAKVVGDAVDVAPVQSATEVADAAADVMVESTVPELSGATETASTRKPIRWVTDIPGFDTF